MNLEQLESRINLSMFALGSTFYDVRIYQPVAETDAIVDDGNGNVVGLAGTSAPVTASRINTIEVVDYSLVGDQVGVVYSGPHAQSDSLIVFEHGAVNLTVDNHLGTLSTGAFFVDDYRSFVNGNTTFNSGPVAAGGMEVVQVNDSFGTGTVTLNRTGAINSNLVEDEFYTNDSNVAYSSTFDGTVNGYYADYYFGGSNSGPASMKLTVEAGSTGDMDAALRGNYNGGDSLLLDYVNNSGVKDFGSAVVITNAGNLGNLSVTSNVQISTY